MFRKERVLLTLAVAMSVVSPIGNSSQSDASIAGVVVRDIHVAFKEWRVPTPGSHPHDPLATSDRAIWYTRQMGNLLGRLDPEIGQFREYRSITTRYVARDDLNLRASGAQGTGLTRTVRRFPRGLYGQHAGVRWQTVSFEQFRLGGRVLKGLRQ
jgi:hypothetical protein|nr:Conserved hypothetical protein [Methylocystis sp. SC2]